MLGKYQERLLYMNGVKGRLGALPNADANFTIHDYVPGQPVPILIKDPKTQVVQSNELKQWVKPYTLVTEPEEVTLEAGAVSDPIPMVLDSKGHFEVFQAFFHSSQPEGFTVQIMDPGDRPLLMNREVHVSTIASGGGVTTAYETFPAVGSAGRPFRWPESFFMNTSEKGRALFCTFRNLSPNQNKIRFVLHGLRWYFMQAPPKIAARMQMIYREKFRSLPFFYTTETNIVLAAAGALASGQFDIRFTDEAWVEVSKLMSFSDGRYNIKIIEKDSSKQYMDQLIRDDLVTGNGEFPFLMWETDLFQPNFKLAVDVANISGAENNVWITLACRKIFWDSKDDRLARPEEAGGMP